MDLRGKRILFFSAKAFGIPENIILKLEEFGAIVDYFDERPANSFIVKALIRINRKLIAKYIDNYHKKIIYSIKSNKYDYILFIKGESFSKRNLIRLFSQHPNAKTIIYHWDSIANNRNGLNLLPLFSKVFSFDRFDCKKYKIAFLPLFYYKEYSDIAKLSSQFEYDCLFVGTTHSDRYKFIKKISTQIVELGGKCFTYFFFQGKIMFYKYKLTHKDMRRVSIKEFYFRPLNKKDLLELYRQSRIIVDIQHPKQSGLTLRTMEALGAKRKLITTNEDIKNYDFYNSHNILIVDRYDPKIPKDFLLVPYKEIDEGIYEKYSLDHWIGVLLG